MSVSFCPLASGSGGNCSFISSGNTSVLIDAGLPCVSAERALFSINKNFGDISAILITHEHGDHVSGAGIISRRYNIPIYATRGTWESIGRNRQTGKLSSDNKRIIEAGSEFTVGDITVKAFEIPHDANEPVGFAFFIGGGTDSERYKIVTATDMGEPNDTIRENLKDSDVLLIESNHDVEMLINGKYPPYLKKRILGAEGHLSNVSAGQLICDVASKNLKHVFLGHLSEENNRPLIAVDTVCRILNANGIKTNCENGVRISVAERYAASAIVELN